MNNFICPVCANTLSESKETFKTLVCKNKHCFDKSKSGYVNLLTSNNMNSKLPGDNKLMVNARRNFLDKGYYSVLKDVIAEQTVKYLGRGIVLDAGCGEGYYTCATDASLNNSNSPHKTIGIDISKTAVDAACKRAKQNNLNIDFAAASIFSLPVADNSCGLLICAFSPYCGEEFRRVLRKNGTMIMVIPSQRHLFGLKSAIYDTPYLNEVKSYSLDGFTFIEKIPVEYEISIKDKNDIQNLFMMTPYFYNTNKIAHERLSELSEIKTEIAFEVLIYKNVHS